MRFLQNLGEPMEPKRPVVFPKPHRITFPVAHLDSESCWCEPYIAYTDGVEKVWVHNEVRH